MGFSMTEGRRKCAYCGDPENLTREHIFPGGIIKRQEVGMLSATDKSDEYFRSDLVVKDVCKVCNNGILSELDSIFCEIYDKYMYSPLLPGSGAKLSFDYHSLLRFLLKVSYNSARASSDGVKATSVLKKLVPYILGKEKAVPDVMLRLQIFTSAKKYNTLTQEIEGVVEANLLRSAKIPYDGPQSSSFIVRLVAFNSYWFYLILPARKVSRSNKEALLKGFKGWRLAPGVPILPNQTTVEIPVERTTYIHPSVLNGMIRKAPNHRVK